LEKQTVKWLDTHIHVSDRGRDGADRPNLLQDLLSVLDAQPGDLRFVLSPDSNWNTLCRNEPDGCHRSNTFIHGLVEEAPGRLYGSCIVNPNYPDEALRTMEVCFEQWGFIQLGELLQYMFGFQMDCDDTERILRKAVEYDVPVQVHISTSNSTQGQPPTNGIDQLRDLFGAVQRVPEAKYILAHAVGMPDDPPVVDQYLDLIDEQYGRWPDNFWAEIRDFSSPGVRSVLDRVPADRLIAGTDWTTRVGPPFLPYGMIFNVPDISENPYPPNLDAMSQLLRDAGATEEGVRRIAFDNAAALLRIA